MKTQTNEVVAFRESTIIAQKLKELANREYINLSQYIRNIAREHLRRIGEWPENGNASQ